MDNSKSNYCRYMEQIMSQGGASRKRIDPFMMLTEDSPSPSPPQVRNDAVTKPLEGATKPRDVRKPSVPISSKGLLHSTSAGKMNHPPPKRGAATMSTQKKTVSSSVSTGRLQSSRTATTQSHRFSSTNPNRKLNSAKPS